MLNGFDKINKRHDTREPINEYILLTLVSVLKYMGSSSYECILFKAAFCLAFYVFLRVGDIAVTPTYGDKNAIKYSDTLRDKNDCLYIRIKSSKTDQEGRSTTLV